MANLLSKLFSGGGGLKMGGEESAVGIDIGSSAIKVVEIKKKGGKAILETYGAIALGPYAGLDAGRVTNLPVDKLGEALKEVLKQSDITKTSGCFSVAVGCVPTTSMLSTAPMLPSRDNLTAPPASASSATRLAPTGP